MTNPQEVIDALNDLLQQNVDARQGYEKARSDVEQSILESYLTDKVVQRQAFIEAITHRQRQPAPQLDRHQIRTVLQRRGSGV